jgi:hypothetical protein
MVAWLVYGGTVGIWWHSWLSQCALSWKVMGSISIEVGEIFHGLNSSGCTTAVKSTQSLKRNGYQEYILGGKGSQ